MTACVILLIVAIAFVVFFSVVLNARRSLGVGIGSTDCAYKTVLADIEGISAANPKIVDIAMLGAHDANTASIQYGNPLDGEGHFIHTYMGDGSPLPSFEGEPKKVAIPNDINEFTDGLWNSLNADNKVSLFVRFIDLATGETKTKIVNKNK